MNATTENVVQRQWLRIIVETKIVGNKDLYYAALGKAQEGWHEGTEDALSFIKYLLDLLEIRV